MERCESVKMQWKLPRPSKACCCIPLRRGIIFFVYLNLAIILSASFAFVMFDYMKFFISIFTQSQQEQYLKLARTKGSYVFGTVVQLAAALAELSMTFVALVGLHKKNVSVIRAYLFYSVIYTAVMGMTRALNFHVGLWMYEIPTIIIFLGFKFYYILLLRSQVKKMEKKQREEAEEAAEIVELNKVCVINNTEIKTENKNENTEECTVKYNDIDTDDTIELIGTDDDEGETKTDNVGNSVEKHHIGS